MTTSDYKKIFPLLKNKPAVLERYIKHNKPKLRSCGKALRKCRRCGRNGAFIQVDGLRCRD